jgi:SSS family solute:Na+ symporter
MVLTTGHVIGIVSGLVLITAVGIYSGKKVKSDKDFAVGGRQASARLISGALLGTLVSGASTVGTAQLAFKFGFSAWWFTLGGGIALAVLGIFMARSFWESDVETIPQYLAKTYSPAIGPISSIFTSIGMYFSMMAQILAFTALLTSMFPLPPMVAACIGLLLTLAYVFFGGVWGAGMVGTVKLTLLYISFITCGVTAYYLVGGWTGLQVNFPNYYPWWSLFGRGFSKDAAAGFSLLVGVLSTQIYIQYIISAKSVKEARKGAVMAGILMPPLGIAGILVGLYMRAYFPDTPSTEVLPIFVLKFLPPIFAGIVLSTLLITAIGGWAGLTLGISTMMTKDIYKKFFRPGAADRETLNAQRILIFITSAIGLIFVAGNFGSLILGWSFLSMGLRGCTVLFPMLGAMFLPRLVTPKAGVVAALLGPLTDFVWYLVFPKGMDPLYPGLAVSLLALIAVSAMSRKRNAILN